MIVRASIARDSQIHGLTIDGPTVPHFVNVRMSGATAWKHSDYATSKTPNRENSVVQPAKPLVIEVVGNTARQQAYALKRYAEQRIAYRGKNGRQERNHFPLDSRDQRTFDRWLCRLRLGERVILVGCKRLNGQLVSLVS